jgi:uncharacterized protein (TIGR02246 family)
MQRHTSYIQWALLLVLTLGGCASAAPRAAAGDSARAEILAMLSRAAGDWNRGDLDAFVADFMDSPRTTFVGSRGVLRGRAAIRSAYAPRFEPGASRDSLSFHDVEVDLLAPGVAHVLGWYVLARGDSVTARGPTSLIMERHAGRWRIVHDHSS